VVENRHHRQIRLVLLSEALAVPPSRIAPQPLAEVSNGMIWSGAQNREGAVVPNVILDRANLIAFASVSGFLDAEQILNLTAQVDEAIQAFGDHIALHGRLFDLSNAKVASPLSIDALRDKTIDPSRLLLRANRVAFFGASPLLKVQMQRICALRPSHAMFDDRRTAFAWAIGGR
jgi:hypothetical protein